MKVECIREFRDFEAKKLRKVGETFEVSPERFAALCKTKYGRLVNGTDKGKQAKAKGRPNKTQLLQEAEALGIDVPEDATNPQIAKLVEEAKG